MSLIYQCFNSGIGDLIIDLDADIEKSSSSNLDPTLVIPLQSAVTTDKKISVEELSDLVNLNNTTSALGPKGKIIINL